jgi:hypothetical protein
MRRAATAASTTKRTWIVRAVMLRSLRNVADGRPRPDPPRRHGSFLWGHIAVRPCCVTGRLQNGPEEGLRGRIGARRAASVDWQATKRAQRHSDGGVEGLRADPADWDAHWRPGEMQQPPRRPTPTRRRPPTDPTRYDRPDSPCPPAPNRPESPAPIRPDPPAFPGAARADHPDPDRGLQR